MLRFVVVVAAVTVSLAPGIALANSVQLTDVGAAHALYGPHFAINGGNGGAFLATVQDDGDLEQGSSFLTFCLEITQTFNLNGIYNYALNDRAISGGNDFDEDPNLPGDPVSDATKWLYYQAISGGYQSLAPLAGVLNMSGAYIQAAIWVLEDEITSSHALANNTVDALVLLAEANAGAWAGLQAAGHHVYAMNLTDASGNQKQDQLAYVKVAEMGSLAYVASGLPVGAILYLALVAFANVRRR